MRGKEKKKIHYPLYKDYASLKKPFHEVFLKVKYKGYIPPSLEM